MNETDKPGMHCLPKHGSPPHRKLVLSPALAREEPWDRAGGELISQPTAASPGMTSAAPLPPGAHTAVAEKHAFVMLDAWLFNAASEVQAAADDWLTDYNEFMPHDALGRVPPVQFKRRVFNQDVSISKLST